MSTDRVADRHRTVKPPVDRAQLWYAQPRANVHVVYRELMLSEPERQALREIERELSAEAPELAARMVKNLPRRPSRADRLAHDVVAVLAAVLAILCFALDVFVAGLVSTLFALDVLLVRYLRFSQASDRGSARS
jgi:hypothetical protein